MMDELVRPGEQKVGLVPPVALQRLAGLGFVRLQAAAEIAGLGGGEHAHRKVVAVTMVGLDGLRREHLRHGKLLTAGSQNV